MARLLFKAQAELNGLLDALPPAARAASHPLLNLQLGPVAFAMGLDGASGSDIQLSCTHGPQEYHLHLKAGDKGNVPNLKARLINRQTGEKRELDGAALFRGEVPEEFAPLHREVTTQLKAWLPEALWTQLRGQPVDTKAPAAQATDTAVAAQPETADQAPATKDPDDGYQQFVLTQRDGPDMRFKGKLIDAVRTPVQRGRWTELHVYQTKGGKYVGVKLGRSMFLGEVDRAEAKVADQLAELADFFGHSPLAKHLTERLGIRQFVDIA